MDYPTKYLVGSIFGALILQAQEPTPSPTAGRLPLRPRHDDSEMPQGAQQPQNVPELLPKSDALPGTGGGAFDPIPNATAHTDTNFSRTAKAERSSLRRNSKFGNAGYSTDLFARTIAECVDRRSAEKLSARLLLLGLCGDATDGAGSEADDQYV